MKEHTLGRTWVNSQSEMHAILCSHVHSMLELPPFNSRFFKMPPVCATVSWRPHGIMSIIFEIYNIPFIRAVQPPFLQHPVQGHDPIDDTGLFPVCDQPQDPPDRKCNR